MEENKAVILELDNINKAVEGFKNEVVELNTKLAAKDATLGDIQNEVRELQSNNKSLKEAAQAGQSFAQQFGAKIKEWEADFAATADRKKFETKNFKTVGGITSSNLATTNYNTYLDWRPGMRPMGQIRFRDIARTIQSGTDFVIYPRHNVPTGEGSFAKVATEAGTKPQVDYDFTNVSLTLAPIAGWAQVSTQALRNIIFLQSYLPETMQEDLLDREDAEFGNALVAAATGSSTTAGVTVAAERLIHFIKNLYVAKYNASAIAADPTVWATVLTTKPNDYSIPGVVSIGPDGNTRIMGRPLYPVNWLTGNRVIVGDWAKTAVVESDGLSFRQFEDGTLAKTNEVLFRLERVEGLAIFRPDAFITTTV